MSANEPPDWALPAWDATDTASPQRAPTRPSSGPAPGDAHVPAPLVPTGRFGLRILQVSDVTRAVREAVRGDERLRELWVEGEVGRVTVSSAGHAYFTLKDDRSQLACVFFRDDRLACPFEPRAGLRVVVQGRVDVFETQGVYQLYVASVQPAGFGDLALRFEALKANLAAEGLFDSARKRQLPVRPAVIGVVTSPTGAVWHDIRNVLRRRWPLVEVILAPCQVQGDAAPASIVAALARLARHDADCRRTGRESERPSVIILARGGGSLEDMWPFNDERVVRAVVSHPVPVVCGVGHETDVSLADFAADVRAPTPSAAAELVTPDRTEVLAALEGIERRQRGIAERSLAAAARALAEERRALDRLGPFAQLRQARERAGLLLDRATRVAARRMERAGVAEVSLAAQLLPVGPRRLALAAERVDRSAGRLPALAVRRLSAARASLEAAHAALAALGPQATLDRGYAIVRRASDGAIVRGPAQAPPSSLLDVRVARGSLRARVESGEANAGSPGSRAGGPGGSVSSSGA